MTGILAAIFILTNIVMISKSYAAENIAYIKRVMVSRNQIVAIPLVGNFKDIDVVVIYNDKYDPICNGSVLSQYTDMVNISIPENAIVRIKKGFLVGNNVKNDILQKYYNDYSFYIYVDTQEGGHKKAFDTLRPEKYFAGYEADNFKGCFKVRICHKEEAFTNMDLLDTNFRNGAVNLHASNINNNGKVKNCIICHTTAANGAVELTTEGYSYKKYNRSD